MVLKLLVTIFALGLRKVPCQVGFSQRLFAGAADRAKGNTNVHGRRRPVRSSDEWFAQIRRDSLGEVDGLMAVIQFSMRMTNSSPPRRAT
jgi:hypothetical protein